MLNEVPASRRMKDGNMGRVRVNVTIVIAGLSGAVLLMLGVLSAFWFWPSSSAGTSEDGLAVPEYQGTRLDGPAPDFRLTDHRGQSVALSDFRGQVVLLTFMDAVCTETCPLTSLELRKAHHLLGEGALFDVTDQLAFLGVNVNVDYNRQADGQAFTNKFALDVIPSWHFLTGTAQEQRSVWQAYDIDVYKTDPDEEEYQHTPGVFIIDQNGELRWYVSVPLLLEGLVEAWRGPALAELLVKHVRPLLP